MVPSIDTTNLDVHSQILMSTEPKTPETTAASERASASVPAPAKARRPYVAPAIERRIPVAANTLQPTSGNQSVLPEE